MDDLQTDPGDFANAVRDKILEAAVRQFSDLGFEGASTRAISAEAGVAMSSITYQFGGKEGLYLATASYIAEQISQNVRPKIAFARQAVDAGTLSAKEAILAILGGMVGLMLDERSEPWAKFIIREQQAPSEAFERLFSEFIEPMAEALIGLVAMVRTDLAGLQLRAAAMGLISQVIALRAARAAMMRVLGFTRIGPDEHQLIHEGVQANVRAILEAKG